MTDKQALGGISGSRASTEPQEGLGPSGFDPGREDQICPYALTDARAVAWCDGYQAALRWMREAMQ